MAGGYRSPSGLWIGGASAPSEAPKAGYVSVMAFWIGGVSSGVAAPPPPSPSLFGQLAAMTYAFEQLWREDEELIIL